MREVGKICDFKPIQLSETGRAVWRPLASVKETSLLGDFVRTRLLNMHRCCAFLYALAELFLSIQTPLVVDRAQ